MSEKDTEFMDEDIIEMINDKEREIEQKLNQERIERQILEGRVTVDDEIIEFEEKSFFDDKIKIRIPKDFEVMTPEIASIKYPFEKRPSIIFTNDTTTKNISFNYTDSAVTENKIDKFADSMLQVLQRLQPTAVWLEGDTKEINSRKLSFFEFITQAVDTDVYNLMFFAELDGKALICSINCIEEEMENWRLVSKGMMSSFKILDR